jgi:hypothetical protein
LIVGLIQVTNEEKNMKKFMYCMLAFLSGLLVASNLGCAVSTETGSSLGGYEVKAGAGLYVGKDTVDFD